MRDTGQQSGAGGGSLHGNVAAPLKLRVQDDALRGTHVEGLVEEGLRSVDHLEQLLRLIEARRQASGRTRE